MNANYLTLRFISNRYRFFCLLLAASLPGMNLAAAQADGLALQQRGIKRIEAYIEHFRKTGDLQSLLPDLPNAAQELTASHAELLRRGRFRLNRATRSRARTSQNLLIHRT